MPSLSVHYFTLLTDMQTSNTLITGYQEKPRRTYHLSLSTYQVKTQLIVAVLENILLILIAHFLSLSLFKTLYPSQVLSPSLP